MTGVSASFTRHFILSLDPDTPTPLRQAQTHAIEKAQCSLQTAKRLTRLLATEGYIVQEKAGRSYITTLTPSGVEFATQLLSSDFGRSNQLPAPTTTLSPQGLDLTTHVPRQTWSELMRQVKEQDQRTAFIPRHAQDLRYTDPNGETIYVPVL